jgi:hypothetical protein
MALKWIGAIAAIAFSTTLAFAGDPVGHYKVDGTGPSGGNAYSGEVSVEKTGDTYKVVWTIGQQEFIGTGVGNDEFMTVAYKSGDNTGIALYGQDGTGWKGIWTYAGGTTLGTEKWTRE